MKNNEFDIVVVGAGTSGSATAYHFARFGFNVALLDALPFDKAGPTWSNGLAPWMIDRAEIDQPSKPELMARDFPVVMMDKTTKHRIFLEKSPLHDLDMRLLVARLQKLAIEKGCTAFEQTIPERFHFENDRPTTLTVTQTLDGKSESFDLKARLFVDATGRNGALRSKVPQLARICPPVASKHLCTAAQEVHEIADVSAAREALAQLNLQPETANTLLGVEGGFSTIMYNVSFEHEHVAILCGSLADGRFKTGPELMEEFLAQRPWIGPKISGGSALIPMRRPYDCFALEGIALVGNAACQVFPAHASGICTGMIAGLTLAQIARKNLDPGCREVMWGYQHAFMTEFGKVNAAYDVFRRLSQTLTSEDIGALLFSGLNSPTTSFAAINQHMPPLSPSEIVRLLFASIKAPSLAGRMLPEVAKMNLVYRLYERYPRRAEPKHLKRWSRAVARIFNETPDIA